jgi:iron(III) transport system substrate-binding protein
MSEAFQRETGINVLMTRRSSGETYAQIKAEEGQPRGDIWWGGTGDPHLQAAQEGLTEAYESPMLGELQDWAVRQAEPPTTAPWASMPAAWASATTPT